MYTFLDLVNGCDNFPSVEQDPNHHETLVSSYFKLYLLGHETVSGPHGYVTAWVVDKMPWGGRWDIDKAKKRLTPRQPPGSTVSQSELLRDTLLDARRSGTFRVLDGWRNELYPILGHHSRSESEISMERAGSPLFGINTYGIHMTVYTKTSEGPMIWVPRRSQTKQTYAGMLDNTVAGGLATGEAPFEAVIRESSEEASLSEDMVRSRAKSCGTVSYIHIRDKRAGGESDLLQPECQFVYDMEVERDVIPKPHDTEVEIFYLWTVEEVKRHLTNGEFKPNCALVLLDWFVRHGFMTAENEPSYLEIVSRLHRTLPFPTSGQPVSPS